MKPSLLVICLLAAPAAVAAQDPVTVDATHYKVAYEDPTIRVLRVTYGPHEKSVMHEHPYGTCAIFLSASHGQFTGPDGKVTPADSKAGDVTCQPMKPGTEKHLPANLGDKPMEVIVIERKAPKP